MSGPKDELVSAQEGLSSAWLRVSHCFSCVVARASQHQESEHGVRSRNDFWLHFRCVEFAVTAGVLPFQRFKSRSLYSFRGSKLTLWQLACTFDSLLVAT